MIPAAKAYAALVASITILVSEGAPLRAEEGVTNRASPCAEDNGEAPTISRRFDLQPQDGGTGFRDARTSALRWCAQQQCTVDGRPAERTAQVYVLGQMKRRYVVGFRCLPSAASPGEAAPIVLPLTDPSGIDTARAKANERCASAKAQAELEDLARENGALVATFVCRS